MDPAEWGEKWASLRHGGSGTATLTFTHTVVEPNVSTQGIAVLENTLQLNGGGIQSKATDADANLSHDGPRTTTPTTRWTGNCRIRKATRAATAEATSRSRARQRR